MNQWQKQNEYSIKLKQEKQIGWELSTCPNQKTTCPKALGKYYVSTLQFVQGMRLINQILREKIFRKNTYFYFL